MIGLYCRNPVIILLKKFIGMRVDEVYLESNSLGNDYIIESSTQKYYGKFPRYLMDLIHLNVMCAV